MFLYVFIDFYALHNSNMYSNKCQSTFGKNQDKYSQKFLPKEETVTHEYDK